MLLLLRCVSRHKYYTHTHTHKHANKQSMYVQTHHKQTYIYPHSHTKTYENHENHENKRHVCVDLNFLYIPSCCRQHAPPSSPLFSPTPTPTLHMRCGWRRTLLPRGWVPMGWVPRGDVYGCTSTTRVLAFSSKKRGDGGLTGQHLTFFYTVITSTHTHTCCFNLQFVLIPNNHPYTHHNPQHTRNPHPSTHRPPPCLYPSPPIHTLNFLMTTSRMAFQLSCLTDFSTYTVFMLMYRLLLSRASCSC